MGLGWLGLILGLMIPLCAALWWAKPDGTGLSIGMTMLFLILCLGVVWRIFKTGYRLKA